MRHASVVNLTSGAALGSRVRVADRWWQRLRGLLFQPAPLPGEGLLLTPCRAVHTFGMRYRLDVAVLDRDDRVVALYPELAPWRATRTHPAAARVLELPAGRLRASGTAVGDRVSIR